MPVPASLRPFIHTDDTTFDAAPQVVKDALMESAFQRIEGNVREIRSLYHELRSLTFLPMTKRQRQRVLYYVDMTPMTFGALALPRELYDEYVDIISYMRVNIVESQMNPQLAERGFRESSNWRRVAIWASVIVGSAVVGIFLRIGEELWQGPSKQSRVSERN